MNKKLQIAVVGNGPFNKEWGAFIDNCDVVIRFNTFKMIDYEKYVGSKTTIWCFSSHHATGCLNHEKDYLIPNNVEWQNLWIIRRRLQQKINPKLRKMADDHKGILSILTSDEKDTAKESGCGFPSTGIIGLRRALLKYKGHSIYIFGFNGFRKSDKLHYYSPSMSRPTQVHKGAKEAAYVQCKLANGEICDLKRKITLL